MANNKPNGIIFSEEKKCVVCGEPVADIHDKFCSKKCVDIKNETAFQKTFDAKKYRAENKKRISEVAKKRYDENKERILAQKKQYYEANREIILAKLKAKRGKACVIN